MRPISLVWFVATFHKNIISERYNYILQASLVLMFAESGYGKFIYSCLKFGVGEIKLADVYILYIKLINFN